MTEVYDDFRSAVNMTAAELEKWLKTEESREVGQKKSDGEESVGHDSGRKIVGRGASRTHTSTGSCASFEPRCRSRGTR